MSAKRLPVFVCILALNTLLGLTQALAEPSIQLPRTGISVDELALLINDNDPLSRETGAYYQRIRQIPEKNVIHLHFPAGKTALSVQEFEPIKAAIDRLTPSHIQAYAVAWTQPYRVGCMSMTSALAFGFDEKYCPATCGPSAASPYFNTGSTYPFDDHKMRTAMMLAGERFDAVKALIDRGLAADRTFPEGTAYLLNTSDKARSVRAGQFGIAKAELGALLPIEEIEADSITGRQDVLFYFTGLTQVPNLGTLKFLPGALDEESDVCKTFAAQVVNAPQKIVGEEPEADVLKAAQDLIARIWQRHLEARRQELGRTLAHASGEKRSAVLQEFAELLLDQKKVLAGWEQAQAIIEIYLQRLDG